MSTVKIGIIMGSQSDLPVMQQAAEICREFGVDYELTIVSAHRTPERMMDYAKSAAERGIQVGVVYFANAGWYSRCHRRFGRRQKRRYFGSENTGGNGSSATEKNAGL